MKKIFAGFLGVLLLLSIWKWNANGRPLNLYHSLEVIEAQGQFFSINEIYQDIQYVRYTTDNITNYLQAEQGSYYTEYTYTAEETEHTIDTIKGIFGIQGINVIWYVNETTQYRPEVEDFFDVLALIGNVIEQTWLMGYYIGQLVVDTVESVLKGIWGIVNILVNILFN